MKATLLSKICHSQILVRNCSLGAIIFIFLPSPQLFTGNFTKWSSMITPMERTRFNRRRFTNIDVWNKTFLYSLYDAPGWLYSSWICLLNGDSMTLFERLFVKHKKRSLKEPELKKWICQDELVLKINLFYNKLSKISKEDVLPDFGLFLRS